MTANDILYARALLKRWHQATRILKILETTDRVTIKARCFDGGSYDMPLSYFGPPDEAIRAYCTSPVKERIARIEAELKNLGVTEFAADDVKYKIANDVDVTTNETDRYRLVNESDWHEDVATKSE